MREYRIFFLDTPTNHISQPPKIVECANDQEAVQKAKQFIDGRKLNRASERIGLLSWKTKRRVRPPEGMSAIGTKRAYRTPRRMSAFGRRADIFGIRAYLSNGSN